MEFLLVLDHLKSLWQKYWLELPLPHLLRQNQKAVIFYKCLILKGLGEFYSHAQKLWYSWSVFMYKLWHNGIFRDLSWFHIKMCFRKISWISNLCFFCKKIIFKKWSDVPMNRILWVWHNFCQWLYKERVKLW